MNREPLTTELLNQDPESFNEYFCLVEQDSREYNERVDKIKNFWADWPGLLDRRRRHN